MEMKIVFTGGKKVEVRYNSFVFFTDQPIEFGGEASAPEPYTYFLASLGACAGFYVLAFCQSRGILTNNISLTQRALPKSNGKGLDKIEIELHLPPSFPKQYVQAVIRAVDNCMVKKILYDPPEIKINPILNLS